MLDERLKAIEGRDAFGLDALNICLEPDVVIPQNFKTPDFEKYKGVNCPKIHFDDVYSEDGWVLLQRQAAHPLLSRQS